MSVCPKCGKDLVLSKPDGSPLLDGYVHMECASCNDKVRYKVLKSSSAAKTNGTKTVKETVGRKMPFKVMLPMVIIIVVFILAIANMQGLISLPSLGGSSSDDGSIVGTWVAGSTTLTFTSSGTYTETYNGDIFDTGTYTISGNTLTMVSKAGGTGSGTYSVSGNTLTGVRDALGNLVTYTR